jgi:hypothetical protein
MNNKKKFYKEDYKTTPGKPKGKIHYLNDKDKNDNENKKNKKNNFRLNLYNFSLNNFSLKNIYEYFVNTL